MNFELSLNVSDRIQSTTCKLYTILLNFKVQKPYNKTNTLIYSLNSIFLNSIHSIDNKRKRCTRIKIIPNSNHECETFVSCQVRGGCYLGKYFGLFNLRLQIQISFGILMPRLFEYGTSVLSYVQLCAIKFCGKLKDVFIMIPITINQI